MQSALLPPTNGATIIAISLHLIALLIFASVEAQHQDQALPRAQHRLRHGLLHQDQMDHAPLCKTLQAALHAPTQPNATPARMVLYWTRSSARQRHVVFWGVRHVLQIQATSVAVSAQSVRPIIMVRTALLGTA